MSSAEVNLVVYSPLSCATVMKTNADRAKEYNYRLCWDETFIHLKMHYKVVVAFLV